jgi:hypothetical protein
MLIENGKLGAARGPGKLSRQRRRNRSIGSKPVFGSENVQNRGSNVEPGGNAGVGKVE